jgi:hypothetical protein
MVTDYDLRFAVATKPGGGAEVMYFASPQDAGTTIRLTMIEREKLAHALAVPGFHPIARDEGGQAS